MRPDSGALVWMSPNLLGEPYRSQVLGHIAGAAPILAAALMPVALLHCRNVDTVPVPTSLSRQRRRALIRSGMAPYTYHRLRITPHDRRAAGNVPSGDGGDVALHLVRGHFKTYTADAPLLGRHIGTWWWMPMVRGTSDRIADKDYEVGL